MKKIVKPLVGALLAAAMLSSSVTVGAGTVTGTIEQQDAGESTSQITAADKPYLSLGADLTEDQKATVLSLMGVDASQLDQYDVVYVTNSEEHSYLDSYIASSEIGSRSLSSVVLVKKDSGS